MKIEVSLKEILPSNFPFIFSYSTIRLNEANKMVRRGNTDRNNKTSITNDATISFRKLIEIINKTNNKKLVQVNNSEVTQVL